MIFISAPYADNNSTVIQNRYAEVARYFDFLANKNVSSVSTILIGHPLVVTGLSTVDYDFWLPYSETLLKVCDQLHVLMLPGWDVSDGCEFERTLAHKLGISIMMVSRANDSYIVSDHSLSAFTK